MIDVSLGGGSGPSGWYELRVVGQLSERWARLFPEMELVALANGEMLLRGPVADQAALHSLLGTIRDLNLRLISLRQVPPREVNG